jgi:hypothetical protein
MVHGARIRSAHGLHQVRHGRRRRPAENWKGAPAAGEPHRGTMAKLTDVSRPPLSATDDSDRRRWRRRLTGSSSPFQRSKRAQLRAGSEGPASSSSPSAATFAQSLLRPELQIYQGSAAIWLPTCHTSRHESALPTRVPEEYGPNCPRKFPVNARCGQQFFRGQRVQTEGLLPRNDRTLPINCAANNVDVVLSARVTLFPCIHCQK